MAYQIKSDCISHGVCEAECPVSVIFVELTNTKSILANASIMVVYAGVCPLHSIE